MWEHIFLKKNAGIFRSVTLPLETLDKIWKKPPELREYLRVRFWLLTDLCVDNIFYCKFFQMILP